MRSGVGIIGAGALAIACGGIAQTGSRGTPDTANGGFGGAGGGYGGLGLGGPGLAGAAGIGGAPSCVEALDVAEISVYSALPFDVDAGEPGNLDLSFDGPIYSVSTDRFVISSGPDEIFGIDAPGLDLIHALHEGAFAHVHYVGRCFASGSCTNAIVVTSLPTWQGDTNPFPSRSGLYVAADNGGVTPSDAPFAIDHVPLPGCPAPVGGGCGGEAAGPYLLRFTALATGARADVPMGNTEWLPLGRGGVLAHDLRSFVGGACKDDSDWAYWATDGAQPL